VRHHKREIQQLCDNIIDAHEYATLEEIIDAEDIREDVEPDLSKVMQADAFDRHLTEYLAAAKRAQSSGRLGQFLPDGTLHEDEAAHLCNCSRPTCPVKNETLPAQVTRADQLDEGIRHYQNNHLGDAVVLTAARDDFAETCAEIKQTLRRAVATIRSMDTDSESEEAAADA